MASIISPPISCKPSTNPALISLSLSHKVSYSYKNSLPGSSLTPRLKSSYREEIIRLMLPISMVAIIICTMMVQILIVPPYLRLLLYRAKAKRLAKWLKPQLLKKKTRRTRKRM